MTANIREDGADDCEGFAAGMASLMYGIANSTPAEASTQEEKVLAAARAMCRCWVPMVTLGQATRFGSEGDQYDLSDGTNAHSWAVLIPTICAHLTSQSQPTGKRSVQLDEKIMLNKWTAKGLPVLLLDGTRTEELYPRLWTVPGDTTDFANNLSMLCVNVMRPLDPTFHQICRSAYTPYGLVSAEDESKRAFEVYWYSLIDAATVINHLEKVVKPEYEKENTRLTTADIAPYVLQANDALLQLGKRSTFVKQHLEECQTLATRRAPIGGKYLRFGAPTVDLFRLPHAKPFGFCTTDSPQREDLGTKLGNDWRPWLAATMCVSESDLAVLRVAAAQMHPVRCAPPALNNDSTKLSAAVKMMASVTDTTPLKSAANPWAAPPRAMTMRYKHAMNASIIERIMTMMHEQYPAKRVHVSTLCFWGGEPQLVLVDNE